MTTVHEAIKNEEKKYMKLLESDKTPNMEDTESGAILTNNILHMLVDLEDEAFVEGYQVTLPSVVSSIVSLSLGGMKTAEELSSINPSLLSNIIQCAYLIGTLANLEIKEAPED